MSEPGGRATHRHVATPRRGEATYDPVGFSKPELEFVDPTASGRFEWVPVVGDLTGQLAEMILSGSHESGWVSRLLRFDPGCDTSPNGTLTHDVWEEVFIVSGEIRDLRLGETFPAGMYACRPPGMEHGPWISESGAVTFEIRFPEPRDRGAARP